MYPVNYLLSKLQNRYRSAIFEGQTNLFEVQDTSIGTILDTTTDAYFLSYLSGVIGNYSINGNNQISLTPAEVAAYLGARMYYYNPKILDTLIFSNFTVKAWFDLTDFSLPYTSLDADNISGIGSKQSILTTYTTAMYNPSWELIPLRTTLVNDYVFRCIAAGGNQCPLLLTSLFGNYLTNVALPFTLFGVVQVINSFSAPNLIHIYSADFSTSINLSIVRISSNFVVTLTVYQDSVLKITLSKTFSIPVSGICYFVVTSDGSNFYLYCNEETVDSDSASLSSSYTFDEAILLCPYDGSEAFQGVFFESGLISSFLTEASVPVVQNYLKTKYFLAP